MELLTHEEMNNKINAFMIDYTTEGYELLVEDYEDNIIFNLTKKGNKIVLTVKKEAEKKEDKNFATAMTLEIIAENEDIYFEIVNNFKNYFDGAEDVTSGTSKLN